MHSRDSLKPHGGGTIVVDRSFAQDGARLETRVCELVVEWTGGRDDFGRGVVAQGSRGDLLGYQIWKPIGGERRLAAWRHVFPAITVNAVSTPSGHPKNALLAPGQGNEDVGFLPPGAVPPDTRTPFDLMVGASVTPANFIAKSAISGTSDETPPVPGAFSYGNFWVVSNGDPNDPPGPGWSYTAVSGWWYIQKSGVGLTPQPIVPPPFSPPKSGEELRDGPDTYVLPVRGNGFAADGSFKRGATFDPDFRFAPQLTDTDLNAARPFWPAFPINTYGITLAAMNEDRQVRDFLPTDPRMCCANGGGAGMAGCGSLVYDVRTDGRWDDTAGATLQTAWQVLLGLKFGRPTSAVGAPTPTGYQFALPNTLALQFNQTGAGESRGGFFVDRVYANQLSYGIGALSAFDGGPLLSGYGGVDKHQIGVDSAGRRINAGHLSTKTFFLLGQSNVYDGPIDFQPGDVAPTDNNFLVKVHWYFDTKAPYGWPLDGGPQHSQGVWKLYASTLLTTSTPGGPPKPPQLPPPSFPPPQIPGQPTFGDPVLGGGGSSSGRNVLGANGNSSFISEVDAQLGIVRRGASKILANRHFGISTAELAMTSRVLHPQRYVEGAPDLRYQEGWGDPGALRRHEFTAPVVGRWIAFGAQGGQTGGAYLTNPNSGAQVGADPFVYTQRPGASRYAGGSGGGGEILVPPEVDMTDVDDDFAPSGLTLSTVYSGYGPGARVFFGVPELAGGGVRNGYSAGIASGKLSLYAHDANGVATEVARIEAGGTAGRLMRALGDGWAFGGASDKVSFHGRTPNVVSSGWAQTGLGTVKVITNASSTGDVRDCVGTMMQALIDKGLLSA